jgi:hypothetical protein
MAKTVVKTTLKLKRGAAATWERLNPVLAAGEPGFEIDTGKLKIGNGTARWSELTYINDVVTNDFVTHQELQDILVEINLDNYASREELEVLYNSIVPLTVQEILELCSEK